jgi:two-component system CheB/CheR fusion protein
MKVLVTVASKHGSTREIAGALAEELRKSAVEADLKDVSDVTRFEGYDALILGSAIYAGNWLPEARQFAEQHRAELSRVPVWLFSSGPLGEEDPKPHDDPDKLAASMGGVEWREHRVFVGKLDPVRPRRILIVEVTEMVQSRRELERGNASLNALTDELQAANTALAGNNEETRRTNAALEEAHRNTEEVAARHAQQIEVLAEANRKLITDKEELATRHAQQIEMPAEANRDLLAANQEVTSVNSELRSTLDDFLVTNEESQAAIEEVETLNEEMQATVEEPNTSNADLAARGDELQSLASSLEVQKAELEAILSGLADAVLVVTAEGKPLLMNEAYRRLFGGDEAGEAGEAGANANKEVGLFNYGDGRTARMADEHSRPLLPGETPQARAARGETFSMTFTLASPSGGERRWLEAIGQSVTGDNEQKWGVVVVRDITERSLRIMQEQFTSLASHELRTPLTTIKGYLHMIDKSLKAQKGNERQLGYVHIALGQVDRQMRLIEDLLDVARLQSGKLSLRREPLRLDTLLEQVVKTGQILAKGQTIQLTVEAPVTDSSGGGRGGDGDSGELRVNGDPTRLEQAVLNLLTNAITYAPSSARIDVRLFGVDGAAADGMATAMAEIDVQDYGKGIAANDLSEVFTRFYQVGQGNPLPAQGLGLGLYITREIVEAHGGTISVESTEGEGATFIIRLPLLVQQTILSS